MLPKWLTAAVAAVALVAGIGIWAKVVNCQRLQSGTETAGRREYDRAAEAFEALGDYQDSAEKVQETNYQAAQAPMAAGEYDRAAEAFAALGDYRDSARKAIEARQEKQQSKGLFQLIFQNLASIRP